jgi:hypothetical protein
MNFDDISNPDAGGSIKTLIDTSTTLGGVGATKPNMFDNIAVNKDGTLTILEDVGNAEHNGKIWNFDPVSGKLTMMGKFDPALFGDVTNGSFVAGTTPRTKKPPVSSTSPAFSAATTASSTACSLLRTTPRRPALVWPTRRPWSKVASFWSWPPCRNPSRTP